MSIEHFSKLWTPGAFPGTQAWLESKPRRALFTGAAGSSDAFLVSDLFRSAERTLLVVVGNSKRAEILVEECRTFLDADSVMLFPSRDAVPYNMKSPFGPTIEARLKVLSMLLDGGKRVYVAPQSSLLQKILPRRSLFNKVIRLRPGADVPIPTLASWLTDSGFHRENQVADIGTFSIRGGVIDIYPFLSEHPLRIEFWGDAVDSIREFDVFSQKSLDPQESADIYPMREFCFTGDQVAGALGRMSSWCRKSGVDEAVVRKLEHQWKSMGDLEGAEWFLHWFDLQYSSILDYLPSDALVIWDDLVPPERRFDEARQNYERHLDRVPDLFLPVVSKPSQLLYGDREVEEALETYDMAFVETLETPSDTVRFNLPILEQPQFLREVDAIAQDLVTHARDGYRCVIISPSLGHAERMQELLAEPAPQAEIAIGFLQHGFIDPASKLLLYAEGQLFNRTYRPVRVRKQKSGIPITGFDALVPHDFIVHEDHGIGKFVGVERIQTDGSGQDCMVLQYADSARVYVPVDDFHKVQKYIGKEGIPPSLSKIGTSSWERLKERTRESLKEMAKELIELYARRQFFEGIQFAPDNLWQKEFEDAFIYEETPDQLRAIKEVKEDMESKKPMDRLVCGDVGFGKTEVAMRAAFKAVMSGYQVAILAPTTILAAQHFATFTERMSNFPVRIGLLSRFLRPREQKPVLEKVRDGTVDILIGTHRILSEDVAFKNLGLLVVDEEQRFGVKHKERLKQLRYKVDVLSMTATPIPRTLHMSLVGARDLSIINTPPRNRLPVETSVAEYHDELVKRAVETELDRGGQVYFVNNRIKNLEALQDRIEQLAPKARVIAAHGQMDEKQLDMIMKEFIAGRFDVLLSTVIIENGLDIPNVNTIIINRADTMGLSQLYQLRGRVGRSSEQAFAYLLTPQLRQISEDSLKRLRALEQYTDLGSGFQIAMRDLEIRGAGNILGTAQHGFIAAVGFELYCRLLQESIKELKGEAPAEKKPEVKMEVPLEAYIPTEYVSDGATRIAVYQELSSIADPQSLVEIEANLRDRFGALPTSVQALLLLIRLKLQARDAGLARIAITRDGEAAMSFDGQQDVVKERIRRLFESCSRPFEIEYDTTTVVRTSLVAEAMADRVLEVIDILGNAVPAV